MTTEQELKRAEGIINEARSHGLDVPLVDNAGQKIRLAKELYEHAKAEHNRGKKGEAVIAIMYAGEVQIGDSDPDTKKYQEAIAEAVPENLPIAPDITDSPPQMPFDFVALTDEEVRYYHGAYSACASRASWLLTKEEAGKAAAKQIADHHLEEYIITADRKDAQTNKPKTMEVLKAEASTGDKKISKWRDLQRQHEIRENKIKRLFDNYSTAADRFSREMSMRQIEREG